MKFQDYESFLRQDLESRIENARRLTALNGCKVSPPPYVRTPEEFMAYVERTAQ